MGYYDDPQGTFRHWGEVCLQSAHFPNDLSLPANIFFLAMFAAFLQPQIFLAIKHRTIDTGIFLSLGVLIEVLAYTGLVYNSIDVFAFPYQIITFVTLTLAPTFISAGIYLTLSRLIVVFDGDDAVDAKAARWRPRTYNLIFLGLTIVTLVMQIAGIVLLLAFSYESRNAAFGVLTTGAALQMLSHLLFVGLTTDLAIRWKSRSKKAILNRKHADVYQSKKFKLSIYALALATVALTIRTFSLSSFAYILRYTRFSYSSNSPLFHQTIFFVLDSTMMVIAFLALTVLHPGVGMGGNIWREGGLGRRGKMNEVTDEGVRTEVGSFESTRKEADVVEFMTGAK